MAKFIVLERFKDKDGTHYKKGDVYKGKRIEALSTKKNKYKRPFIQEVKEEVKEEVKDTKETKEEKTKKESSSKK